MWWLFGIGLIAIPLFLWLARRRNEHATGEDWNLVLSPKGESELTTLRHITEGDQALVDFILRTADSHSSRGSMAEAVRFLAEGAQMIERAAPTLLRALALAGVLVRMVSAIAPVAPPRASTWRVGEARRFALLGVFFHHFLVAAVERFKWRLTVLSWIGGALIRRATGTRLRLGGPAPKVQVERRTIEDIRTDVRQLSDETLESLRLAFLAVEREERLNDER